MISTQNMLENCRNVIFQWDFPSANTLIQWICTSSLFCFLHPSCASSPGDRTEDNYQGQCSIYRGQLNRTQIGGEFIRYKGSRTTTRTIQRLGTESLAMTELPLRNLDHLPLCHTFYNHLLVAVNQR